MATKKLVARKPKSRPQNWAVSTQFGARRSTIVPGMEISVRGLPGRSKFVEYVDNGVDDWITVIHRGMFRSVDPGRIYCVHKLTEARRQELWLRRREQAAAAERRIDEANRLEAQEGVRQGDLFATE